LSTGKSSDIIERALYGLNFVSNPLIRILCTDLHVRIKLGLKV